MEGPGIQGQEGRSSWIQIHSLDVRIHSSLSIYLLEQAEVQDVQGISTSQDQGQGTPPTDTGPARHPMGVAAITSGAGK